MAQSQRLVARAAGSAENIQQAKTGAESAIRGFYGKVGWSVAVSWANEASNAAATVEARWTFVRMPSGSTITFNVGSRGRETRWAGYAKTKKATRNG
ncbi:MAG: hypothetical protein ACLP9L_25125 [Thermoguttaceae bacterium]